MVMNTEIDDDGLIIKRDMSANDYPIEERDRRHFQTDLECNIL